MEPRATRADRDPKGRGLYRSPSQKHGQNPVHSDADAPEAIAGQTNPVLLLRLFRLTLQPAGGAALLRTAAFYHHHHRSQPPALAMRVATTTMNRTSVALTIMALCMLLLLALLR
jgi:hypothetical protein